MDHVVSQTNSAASITAEELDSLIEEADKAKMKAYAPYSKFRVGAALIAADGTMYSGSNVENCSYGLAVCAERCAMFNAVNCGVRAFRGMVVTTDVTETTVYPCGACRQVMSEFGNFDIYCVRADGMVSRTTLHDLIPFTFTAHQLSKAPGNSVGQEE